MSTAIKTRALLLAGIAALFLATGAAHADTYKGCIREMKPAFGMAQAKRMCDPKKETLNDWMWCDDALSGDNGRPSKRTKKLCGDAAKRLGARGLL
jgi:hypothetical protein